jgi:hypothetical protein
MPEVLLRVVAGSPCEQAVRSLGAFGRVSPGRRADERVLCIAPRLPTVRMTAEIVLALGARASDRASLEQTARGHGAEPAPHRPAAPRARSRSRAQAAA